MLIKVAIPNQVQLKLIPNFSTLFVGRKNEIHYIGGAEVLPAPLNAEDEARAIARLGTEEGGEARSLLIEHNLRLVVYIAKKFDNTGVGVEDLISIGTIGLIKAINTFNRGKNIKLATYASRCIENEILMYLRRNNKTRLEVSIDEPLNVDWDGNELLLYDILGTYEDVIYRDIETEMERKLLDKAIQTLRTGAHHRGASFWTEKSSWRGDDPEGGGGSPGNLTVLYFQTGKENYPPPEKRNHEIRINYCAR